MSKQHVQPGRQGKALRRNRAANPPTVPDQVWVWDNEDLKQGHWERT